MTARGVLYDSSIFLLSLNLGDRDGAACASLLEFRRVPWIIFVSFLTREETTIAEYLDELEISAVGNGVTWIVVPKAEVLAAQRKFHHKKRALSKLGVAGKDLTQMLSAVARSASSISARDEDYFDPTNKRNRNCSGTCVSDYLSREFAIRCIRPSDLVRELAA